MDKRKFVIGLSFVFIMLIGISIIGTTNNKKNKLKNMNAMVLEVSKNSVTVADKNNAIYTFNGNLKSIKQGDIVTLTYAGLLDENNRASIIDCALIDDELSVLNDGGIFKNFYEMAYNRLKKMTLEEKIGQIFLVRMPDKNVISDLKKYKFAGYIMYERDFKDKTKSEVKKYISNLDENSNIPLLIAVDEEGGKVSRISSNSNLVDTPFKSSSEIYNEGGLEAITEDTVSKSEILKNLGINVNLAPVVDVANDPNSYIYNRTLKQNTSITSKYAKTVIEASKNTGVSYVLKHFPGYGDNADTHVSSTTDNRTYAKLFEDDIPPFKSGIKAGAEAVLVSHNIVPALDKDNPSSLSVNTHNVLRSDLGFTGIIMTDDLDMGAITDNNAVIKAILAGNDLIIVTDYEDAINKVNTAIKNKTINESVINKMALRVLAWKYYKGMMYDIVK